MQPKEEIMSEFERLEFEQAGNDLPINAETIRAFEGEIKFSLPDDFRWFLEYVGTVRSSKYVRVLPAVANPFLDEQGYLALQMIYGLNCDNRLNAAYHLLQSEIPSGFIPVAEVVADYCYLLGLTGKWKGRIYFRLHDEPSGRSGTKNIYEVADNFTDLLKRCSIDASGEQPPKQSLFRKIQRWLKKS